MLDPELCFPPSLPPSLPSRVPTMTTMTLEERGAPFTWHCEHSAKGFVRRVNEKGLRCEREGRKKEG